MIAVSRRELKSAFGTHYSIYQTIDTSKGKSNSRRLILFYAIECGLKALLLDEVKGHNTSVFFNHARYKEKLNGKKGHNIQYILQELRYGPVQLPSIECKRGEKAKPEEYNQVWRYGINAQEEEQAKIEHELQKVATWIRERI